MSKPDPEEFARQVLYNLAALSAEMHEARMMLATVLGHLKSRPPEEFLNLWKDQKDEMTAQLYQTFLDESKIGPPPPEEEPPSQDPEANPRA